MTTNLVCLGACFYQMLLEISHISEMFGTTFTYILIPGN